MEYTEGGENSYVHKLPGRMKYTAIKLSRPVDVSTSKIAAWFTSMKQEVKRSTASITVYDGNKKTIAKWSFDGVFPLRWTGPSLSADGNQVAKETLELAHNGFSPGGGV
jgi:phage tail-like protein